MRSPEQVLSLYRQRLAFYAPLHSKMRMIQQIYNGSFQVPLPDMEDNALPSAPNLLAQGLDQMAGRVASTSPMVQFSSMKPGVRLYDRRAMTAARTVTGWWQAERLPMKMKQRARHFIGYAMSPVVMRWDQRNNRPFRQVRHPLETFPSTDVIPGSVSPTDCLFAYRRSVAWMRDAGYAASLYALTGDSQMPLDATVLLVEYVDSEGTMLLAAGYRQNDQGNGYTVDYTGQAMRSVILEAYPNPGGIMPVVVPMRVTLDSMTGQFDNMVGLYYQQAKLMALEVIAVEKGIFPDTYLISRPGEVGRFLDGPHDGRTGLVNVVAGGDIREVQSQPGYLTNPTIDRLERNQRVTAGIPAEFGGESSTNIRTGRRGDAVLSAVIDYPVAEAQEAFAFALEEENRVAIRMAKRWDGDEQRTIYVGTGNSMKPVTYVPNETFETEDHVVSYPAAGADLNNLIIGIGQRVGLGIMSKQTAATLDPYIDNPESEHDAIIAEGLEQALMSGMQQQAASGQMPPLVVAKVMKLVRNDRMELAEAFNRVTEDALKEQEQMQQAEQAAGPPGGMTAEQAMAPGALAAMAGGMPAIPGATPTQQSLGDMLNTLRKGARG